MDWKAYNKYLRSERWQATRTKALDTKGRWCRGCRTTVKILQVHHKTHANVPNERMADLEILCIDCHKELTALQRQNRHLDGFILFHRFLALKRKQRLTRKRR